jgi:methyl-accepting chemotaxis protein
MVKLVKSLRTKLAISIIVFFVVALGIVAGLNYWQAQKMLTQDVETKIVAMTQSRAKEVGWFFAAAKTELGAITRSPILASGDEKAIVEYLAAEVKNNPIYETMVWADSTGRSVNAQGVVRSDANSVFFKEAMAGKTVITDPYVSRGTGKQVVVIATPIKVQDRVVGILSGVVDVEAVDKLVLGIKEAQTGYASVLRGDGLTIIHPNKEFVNKVNPLNDPNGSPALKAAAEKMVQGEQGITSYQYKGVDKYLAYAPIPGLSWSLEINVPVSEETEKLRSFTWTAISTIVVILVLAALLVFWGTARLVKPLETLKTAVNRIADGDLSQTKVDVHSQDEIGYLARAFESMVENLRKLIKQIGVSSGQVAASSEELTASSEQSTQAANQIAASITEVAQSASEQLNAANDAAAIVEQMSATIQQAAANANQAAMQSTKATEKAKDGGKTVETAVGQMNQLETTVITSAKVVAKLGERSKEIGQIVDTISGIAGQTNLLALNAAIEAARAGEQGRGFAVVAEEVRKLAEQSQEAAKKIAELIGQIQQETDKAVVAMDQGTREVKSGAEVVNTAGLAFSEIVGLVTKAADKINESSAAMQQMAASSQHIVDSVKVIDTSSKKSAGEAQGVSAAAQEQLASMEEIASSSQSLAKLAQDLQNAVTGFRL